MILTPKERIEEYTRLGWWGERTFWEMFLGHVRDRPDAEAAVDAPNRREFAHGEPRRLSWRQLADEVDDFCGVLLDEGVGRDDIVVVQLPNCVEQFIVYLACARLGVVVTPVPVQYRGHELAHILATTRPKAAVTFARIGQSHDAAAMFLGLRSAEPSLASIIAWGEDLPAGCAAADRSAEDAQANRRRVEAATSAAAVTANDVFSICWTSGTEATPKGVPRSQNEWLVVAPSVLEAAELKPGARLLNPFPMVNMAGLSTNFAGWLLLGATIVQHHPFSLPVFLRQLRDERIDYTVAPPAVLNTLLQNAALLDGIDFTRLSRIGSGSAPLSEWMVRGFAEHYGVQIVNYFGSNEGAALTGSPLDIPDPELRAKYFPRIGVDGHSWTISTTRKVRTKLVDPETGEIIVEPGRPGELRCKGVTIFSSYYGAPEMTQRAFDEDGYYKTGDLFEIAGDRLQYYLYVGRSKDLVIRGGMNISAEEIENLLLAYPGVAEAAVVGVPDARLGEKLCACVALREGATLELADMAHFLKNEKQVAVYKLPEYLMVVPELPRNPVGKVLKRELREQAKLLAPEGAKA